MTSANASIIVRRKKRETKKISPKIISSKATKTKYIRGFLCAITTSILTKINTTDKTAKIFKHEKESYKALLYPKLSNLKKFIITTDAHDLLNII